MTFGQRLRQLRRERHMSQRELAARMGVHYSYICNIERDKTGVRGIVAMRRLAEALDMDVEELVLLSGHMPAYLLKKTLDNPLCQELIRVLCLYPTDEATYRELIALAKGNVEGEEVA